MSTREHILIVRLSHLGDVVRGLPVFHALRSARPEATLAWVVQPEFAGLLEGLHGLERIFLFDRRGGLGAWLRLRRELHAFGVDRTVDAQGNLKSTLITLAAGAPRRSGLHRRDWREPLGARVLNDPAPETARGVPHAVDHALTLARHVADGVPVEPRFDPALRDEELAHGRRLWLEHVPPAARERPACAPVILHPGPPADVRSWPAGRISELSARLHGEGRPHLLLSGPSEGEIGRRLERDLPADELRAHWVGQRGLRPLAAFLSAGAEVGASLVGGDSGPLHLAAACGMNVICVAGPQSHLRTGPWPVPGSAGEGSPHRVLLSPEPPACAPCFSRRCTHPRGPVCVADVTADTVARALEEAP